MTEANQKKELNWMENSMGPTKTKMKSGRENVIQEGEYRDL